MIFDDLDQPFSLLPPVPTGKPTESAECAIYSGNDTAVPTPVVLLDLAYRLPFH